MLGAVVVGFGVVFADVFPAALVDVPVALAVVVRAPDAVPVLDAAVDVLADVTGVARAGVVVVVLAGVLLVGVPVDAGLDVAAEPPDTAAVEAWALLATEPTGGNRLSAGRTPVMDGAVDPLT